MGLSYNGQLTFTDVHFLSCFIAVKYLILGRYIQLVVKVRRALRRLFRLALKALGNLFIYPVTSFAQ